MTATVRLKETDHKAGWKLFIDGKPVECNDWEVRSRFGSVQTAVVLDPNSSPVFDRPSYSEAPNVNLVVWGKHPAGGIRIAIIRQPRPHADDPEQPGVDGHNSVVFGQIPMGFAEKVLGESIEGTAIREAAEESGARVVVSVTRPAYPWHNPNPTTFKTWSDLLFVEVNLDHVERLRSTRDEPIFSAEFITPKELIERVARGKDDTGAVYRMCTANSVLFIFFCTYPQYWPR